MARSWSRMVAPVANTASTTSCVPKLAASRGLYPFCNQRRIFSRTTMASSTTRPAATISAISVIILPRATRSMPVNSSRKNQPISTVDGVRIEFDKEWVHLRNLLLEVRIVGPDPLLKRSDEILGPDQEDRRDLNLDIDRVRFPDGSEGELEIIRHPGASAVVPFLSDPRGEDPQILLLRQYRYAADGYLYEIPAGRLDDGETPEACAARELKEEE